MAYQRQSGDDLSDGGFLKTPGWYHLCITQLDDPVQKKDGSLQDGASFRVHCEVLAGTVAGQVGKVVALTYFEPKPSHKDGGEFRSKDGSLQDGASFRVHCEVLAGTVAGQVGKVVALTYFEPKPSHKDGGEF